MLHWFPFHIHGNATKLLHNMCTLVATKCDIMELRVYICSVVLWGVRLCYAKWCTSWLKRTQMTRDINMLKNIFLLQTNTLPTLAGDGHQWTESINTGCNQWLSLAKIALKMPLAGRNRSLVAKLHQQVWGGYKLLTHMNPAIRTLNK
jgi:hypothetical protein